MSYPKYATGMQPSNYEKWAEDNGEAYSNFFKKTKFTRKVKSEYEKTKSRYRKVYWAG